MARNRGDDQRPWTSVALTALVVALLAVGAGGLAERDRYPPLDTPPTIPGLIVSAGVLRAVAIAVVVALVVLFLVVAARKPSGPLQQPATRGHWIARVVVLALFVWLLTLDRLQQRLEGIASRGEPMLPDPAAGDSAPFWSWPVAGGLAALVAAAALLVALALRRSVAPSGHGQPEEDVKDDVGLAADLRVALGAGRGAVAVHEPARQSIIDCYSAMERSLARTGTRRTTADTPTDLLERAAAAGLVHSDAAGSLTDLFRLARFSDRPLPPGSTRAAARALDRLDAEIAAATDTRAAVAGGPRSVPRPSGEQRR